MPQPCADPGAACSCQVRRKAALDALADRKRGTSTRCSAVSNVVDHKTPPRGDKTIFWDKTQWQPLCTPWGKGEAKARVPLYGKDKP